MLPENIAIKDYTYDLPEERIAKYPLAERDQSKLLIYKNDLIEEDVYANLAHHLPENSRLVFNNTKVVEARLLFEKPNGGKIEIFCLEPGEQYADIITAMLQKEKVFWKCLVGGAKKWKEGSLILGIREKDFTDVVLTARKVEQLIDSYLIELSWNKPELSFAEVLHLAGSVPLPPYLNRAVEETDKERYQTVYAKHDGSVAAPTAGLHFTNTLLRKLSHHHIKQDYITLHVGAGTFKPVKATTMQEHEMHAEFIDVSKTFLESLLARDEETIIAVGTTSLRTLESLYWLGVKTKLNPHINSDDLSVTQWEPYHLEQNISKQEAIQSLVNWLDANHSNRLLTKTQIIIAPGYQFRIINALITNFHQPQSTLLLLVAAIVGKDLDKIYNYALENDFRFLSYGDGSLLWLKN